MHHRSAIEPTVDVLVVDDDADTRDSMIELLEGEGYSVVAAGSGARALELLQSGMRPGVLVIDQTMPGMSGAELCAACDAVPELASIPRVIASGSDPRGVPPRRAAAVLIKPLRAEALLTVLRTHLPGR